MEEFQELSPQKIPSTDLIDAIKNVAIDASGLISDTMDTTMGKSIIHQGWKALTEYVAQCTGDADISVKSFTEKIRDTSYDRYITHEHEVNFPLIIDGDIRTTSRYSPNHAEFLESIGALTRNYSNKYAYRVTLDQAPQWYQDVYNASAYTTTKGNQRNYVDDLLRVLTNSNAVQAFRDTRP